MLFSMTGFGKSHLQTYEKEINVEIKSLNSKNHDFKLRLPSSFKEKETEVRRLLIEKLIRGKIDLQIQINDLSGKPSGKINPLVLKKYLEQLREVKPDLDENLAINSIIKLPDVLQIEENHPDEYLWNEIKKSVVDAIEHLIDFRKQEGNSLRKDLENNITTIKKHLDKIIEIDKNRIKEKKSKIHSELEQLKVEIDENRFEQELIYYIEKFDINEEIVRLKNHLDYFLKELHNNKISKGKKLGFISQEIGREINTIGSKANHSEIQRNVVEMKDALEKIKEQVLNVL